MSPSQRAHCAAACTPAACLVIYAPSVYRQDDNDDNDDDEYKLDWPSGPWATSQGGETKAYNRIIIIIIIVIIIIMQPHTILHVLQDAS
jgi:hypothetical protein